ncbi:MAG: hypothetical protein B655_0596 [Methanobacterium sp. Maddingley MBC34]|nr:MAG: hypothetical protein B655_0596 [Methanobacterium sp. Maddingley MBC34]
MNLVNAIIGAFLGILAAMVILIFYNKLNQNKG